MVPNGKFLLTSSQSVQRSHLRHIHYGHIDAAGANTQLTAAKTC